MIEAEIDSDGYPTDAVLKCIKTWPLSDNESYDALIEFVEPIFEHYGKIDRSGGNVKISTGGWSGCEDAIEALWENQMFWLTCWQATMRGGHYKFTI